MSSYLGRMLAAETRTKEDGCALKENSNSIVRVNIIHSCIHTYIHKYIYLGLEVSVFCVSESGT